MYVVMLPTTRTKTIKEKLLEEIKLKIFYN